MDVAELAIRVKSLEVQLANKRMKGLGNQTKITAAAMNTFKKAAAGAIAAVSVTKFVQASESFTRMENSLRALDQSQMEANESLQKLGDIAQRTRAPLTGTINLYQRASIAAKKLGASQNQGLQFTENVGLALAQQGGSAA